MNCETCEARKTDLQTGDEYCKELGALISPGAVRCPRQQTENSFREHIIGSLIGWNSHGRTNDSGGMDE